MFTPKLLFLAFLIASFCAARPAWAASQDMNANVRFDAPLTLTKNADISFGSVVAGVASTYTIDTTGAVSASGGGSALAGPTAVGSITISGSPSQPVSITVGAYVTNNGVTPSNATCSYDGGPEGVCAFTGAPPDSGKTLLIGVRANANGTQSPGATAAPSFTVTVAYQ